MARKNYSSHYGGGFTINLVLSPYHTIHNARIRLNDLHDFRADVLVRIVRYRDAIIAVSVHLNRRIDRLQDLLCRDAREDEVALVERFRALCAGADADRGKRTSDRQNGLTLENRTSYNVRKRKN